MSLFLPKRGVSKRAADSIAASTSLTDVSNAPMLSSDTHTTMAPAAVNNDVAARPTKRKRHNPDGRLMTVKVVYSLKSPRLGIDPSSSSSSSNNTVAGATPESTTAGATPSESSGLAKNTYNGVARLTRPVFVESVSSASGAAEQREFGRLTLKTCLSAVCVSRPELVMDPSRDFAVASLDPAEQRDLPAGQGWLEGRGMLSWIFGERKGGTTFITGDVIRNPNASATELDLTTDEGASSPASHASTTADPSQLDTLQVWLHLVEHSTFTQPQFLSSLRSFAQLGPGQTPSDAPAAAAPAAPMEMPAPTPAAADPLSAILATLQGSAGDAQPTDARLSALLANNKHSATLKPALETIARFFSGSNGNAANSSTTQTLAGLLSSAGLSTQQPQQQAPASEHATSSLPLPPPTTDGLMPVASTDVLGSDMLIDPPTCQSRSTGTRNEVFVALEASRLSTAGINPTPDGVSQGFQPGCANCHRKRSATWRFGRIPATADQSNAPLVTQIVCNACGNFYNKRGRHRVKVADRRVSPARVANDVRSGRDPLQMRVGTTIKDGRMLKPRLTAVCEADLLSQQQAAGAGGSTVAPQQQQRRTGFIAPPSPSKRIGRTSPSKSPGFSAFLNSLANRPATSLTNATASAALTSPGRLSPRMARLPFPGAATSPVRGKGKTRRAAGGAGAATAVKSQRQRQASRKDKASVSATGDAADLSAVFSTANQSPTPRKRAAGSSLPSYLLDASPGTALDRIMRENDIDLSALQGLPAPNSIPQGSPGSFLAMLQSSSPNKENKLPGLALPTDSSMPAPSDFDDALFSALNAAGGFDGPSSAPSSPCVQPRTGSATPGSKSKPPASGRRPPPSLFTPSFLDSLVPAVSFNAGEGATSTVNTDSALPSWEDPFAAHLIASSAEPLTSLLAESTSHPEVSGSARPPAFFANLPPSSPPMFTPESEMSGVTPDDRLNWINGGNSKQSTALPQLSQQSSQFDLDDNALAEFVRSLQQSQQSTSECAALSLTAGAEQFATGDPSKTQRRPA